MRGSENGYQLDLRETCLQAVELEEMNFEYGDFTMAQMEGANLNDAQMQGAELIGVYTDKKTSLSTALLRGVALREVDFTTVSFSQEQVDDMFGDGSVKLPKTLTRPKHWPQETLNGLEFETQWRAWQKKIGTDPSTDKP